MGHVVYLRLMLGSGLTALVVCFVLMLWLMSRETSLLYESDVFSHVWSSGRSDLLQFTPNSFMTSWWMIFRLWAEESNTLPQTNTTSLMRINQLYYSGREVNMLCVCMMCVCLHLWLHRLIFRESNVKTVEEGMKCDVWGLCCGACGDPLSSDSLCLMMWLSSKQKLYWVSITNNTSLLR